MPQQSQQQYHAAIQSRAEKDMLIADLRAQLQKRTHDQYKVGGPAVARADEAAPRGLA